MGCCSTLLLLASASLALGQAECPGYAASNVQETDNGLTTDLSLAGQACNVFGTDLPNLTLTVEYQAGRLMTSGSWVALTRCIQILDYM